MDVKEIYIGQTVYMFDYHFEEFISDTVESIKQLEDGSIMVNGRFDLEDVFISANDCYMAMCDYETKTYRTTIKNIMEKYNDFMNKPKDSITSTAEKISEELNKKWSENDDREEL